MNAKEIVDILDGLKTGDFAFVDFYREGDLTARVYDFKFYRIGHYGECNGVAIGFDGANLFIFDRAQGGTRE